MIDVVCRTTSQRGNGPSSDVNRVRGRVTGDESLSSGTMKVAEARHTLVRGATQCQGLDAKLFKLLRSQERSYAQPPTVLVGPGGRQEERRDPTQADKQDPGGYHRLEESESAIGTANVRHGKDTPATLRPQKVRENGAVLDGRRRNCNDSGGGRKRNVQSRAAKRRRFRSHAPIVKHDDLLNEREAEPRAAALQREERMKHPFSCFRFDPGAVVIDADAHALVRLVERGLDNHRRHACAA